MAERRFADLPRGAAFIWRGGHYVKVGPLLARMEGDDESVLVPRSALVTPLSEPAGPTTPSAADLARLEEELIRLVRGLPLEPTEIQATLEKIRDLFRSFHPSATDGRST